MKLLHDTQTPMTNWDNERHIPAAGDCSYFTERQLEKHLFLVIDDIYSSPVDCNNHLVLWKTRSRKLVCLIETREQQRPLVLGIVDNVFLHSQWRHSLFHKVAVSECTCNCLQKPSPTFYFAVISGLMVAWVSAEWKIPTVSMRCTLLL